MLFDYCNVSCCELFQIGCKLAYRPTHLAKKSCIWQWFMYVRHGTPNLIICTCIQLKVCTYKPLLKSPCWWEWKCQKPSQLFNSRMFSSHVVPLQTTMLLWQNTHLKNPLKSWIPYINDKRFCVHLGSCSYLDFLCVFYGLHLVK